MSSPLGNRHGVASRKMASLLLALGVCVEGQRLPLTRSTLRTMQPSGVQAIPVFELGLSEAWLAALPPRAARATAATADVVVTAGAGAALGLATEAGAASGVELLVAAPSEEDLFRARVDFPSARRTLHNEYDMIYTARAEVGTPPKPIKLVVDTGSSDLWVGQASYKAKGSSTSQHVSGPSQLLRYGRGQVRGHEVKDRVCIEALCVRDQTFIAASQVDGIGAVVGPQGLFDGLLGLAYPALAAARGAPTLLEEMAVEGPWKDLAFGLCLRHAASGEDSFVTFGNLGHVSEEASGCSPNGPGVLLPVLTVNFQAKFWLALGLLSASSAAGAPPGLLGQVPMVFDSGTSLIAVPAALFGELVGHLFPRGTLARCGTLMGQPACPCDLPVGELKFIFPGENGIELVVTLGREDLLQPVGTAQLPTGETLEVCRLALQPSPPSLPFVILGDVFLRHVYAVHDVRGFKVTLYPQSKPRGSGLADMMANAQLSAQVVIYAGAAFAAMALCAALAVAAIRPASSTATTCSDEGYARL